MDFDFVLMNKIIIVVINLIGWILAISVFLANKKGKTNKVFFWWLATLLAWIDFDFVSAFSRYIFPNDMVAVAALWSARLSWVFVSLFAIFTYLFVIHFPKERYPHKFWGRFYIVVWGIWLALSCTNYVVSGVEFSAITTGQKGGLLIVPILVFLGASFIHYFYLLFEKYPTLNFEEKNRAQYFLVGASIFGLVAFALNIILPIFSSGDYVGSYYVYGEYSSIFMFALTAYAIIKKQMFGMKVLLTQVLVLLMGVALFFVSFIVPLLWMKMVAWGVFALFCVFGYILIQSISFEYSQRFKLEAEVQEKIGEIERSKKILEEAKAVLEIRVAARTRELKELSQNLDEQVKIRTQELEKKIAELERANKLMVDREIRMAELKRELNQLKGLPATESGYNPDIKK